MACEPTVDQGAAGASAQEGQLPAEAGRTKADVDNKELKRTCSAILLKVKEILAFRGNELHGVKPFVM